MIWRFSDTVIHNLGDDLVNYFWKRFSDNFVWFRKRFGNDFELIWYTIQQFSNDLVYSPAIFSDLVDDLAIFEWFSRRFNNFKLSRKWFCDFEWFSKMILETDFEKQTWWFWKTNYAISKNELQIWKNELEKWFKNQIKHMTGFPRGRNGWLCQKFVMYNLVFKITSCVKTNLFIYLFRKTRGKNENELFDCLL